eukprot:3095160-Lingulodinium_polyedra.AAC.1
MASRGPSPRALWGALARGLRRPGRLCVGGAPRAGPLRGCRSAGALAPARWPLATDRSAIARR